VVKLARHRITKSEVSPPCPLCLYWPLRPLCSAGFHTAGRHCITHYHNVNNACKQI
jgi:hypothetical protein